MVDTLTLSIRVKCRRHRIAIIAANPLTIALSATPHEGAANQQLIDFLAKFLRVPKSKIQLIKGKRSALKTITIQTTDPTLYDRLQP